MSIDFSKYTVKELHEAWISIDDYAYPERAIEIYKRLKAHGEEAYDDSYEGGNFLEEARRFITTTILFDPITSDMQLDNDLARMKEQRVLELIRAQSEA
ncbi:hypothetical protein [Pseudoalteromonas pernae]|uniref:hypothetical protein n=1 Tax=Pseudoalteromonas pernae TaxID=3118054 RepID=UPI003242A3BA